MSKEVKSYLLRVARWIWWGILLQTSLFAFYGVNFFLSETFASHALVPLLLFSFLAAFTFFYGTHFFKKYTELRRQKIMSLNEKSRREALLLAVVIQLLLIQFICVLGILLSIFQQQAYYVYPFFIAFGVGMWKSFPQPQWFQGFFEAQS